MACACPAVSPDIVTGFYRGKISFSLDETRKLALTIACCVSAYIKGTVSPDYKCLEVISIKSPMLGHVTPDI